MTALSGLLGRLTWHAGRLLGRLTYRTTTEDRAATRRRLLDELYAADRPTERRIQQLFDQLEALDFADRGVWGRRR